MELVHLSKPDDASTEAIQERSRKSSRGSLTQHYACKENGQEVALVSLDIYSKDRWPEQESLFIYELFVPPPLWNQGIGTRALAAAEEFARAKGYRKTVLYARPLFEHRTDEEMIGWYQRRGYKLASDATCEMEKIL